MYMTYKACERVVSPLDLSKVVNLYGVSNVSNTGAKASKETNFECLGILMVCEPGCMKYDGTIRTFYDSFECRHPDIPSFGALLKSFGCWQVAKGSQVKAASLMTQRGSFKRQGLFEYAVRI